MAKPLCGGSLSLYLKPNCAHQKPSWNPINYPGNVNNNDYTIFMAPKHFFYCLLVEWRNGSAELRLLYSYVNQSQLSISLSFFLLEFEISDIKKCQLQNGCDRPYLQYSGAPVELELFFIPAWFFFFAASPQQRTAGSATKSVSSAATLPVTTRLQRKRQPRTSYHHRLATRQWHIYRHRLIDHLGAETTVVTDHRFPQEWAVPNQLAMAFW